MRTRLCRIGLNIDDLYVYSHLSSIYEGGLTYECIYVVEKDWCQDIACIWQVDVARDLSFAEIQKKGRLGFSAFRQRLVSLPQQP